jgi:predicted nucleic acid-binding protein
MAEKRGRLRADEIPRFLSLLGNLEITIDHQGVAHTMDKVVPLARHHKLTVYDATYLELALRAAIPMATLDKRLAEAFTALGGVLI